MGRPRTFDMEEALSAVREEFWEHGYAATSIDMLLDATKLGKGSFYAAFGDKRTVFLRVLNAYATTRVANVKNRLHGSRRAIEGLQAMLAPTLGPRGCFLANCTAELSPQDGDVVAIARTMFSALEEVLAETIRRAIDEGDLPETTRPRELASVLLATGSGLELLRRSGPDMATAERMGRNAARELLGNAKAGNKSRHRSKA